MTLSKYILISLFIFLVVTSVRAQSLSNTEYNFTSFDVQNYLYIQQKQIAYKIYELLDEKKVEAFEDVDLKIKTETDSFSFFETIQIPNPSNPDDIYDLIDTTLYYSTNPYSATFQLYSDNILGYMYEKDTLYLNYTQLKKRFLIPKK